MSSVQNDPNLFRDLNLQRLKNLANSWVNKIGEEIPNVCIEDITLYSYSSHYAEIQSKRHPVKYCVVFGIKDETVHESGSYINSERFKPIYSFLGIFQTVDICRLLLNSGFCEAYNYRPENDYENEWIFLTRKLAEGNPGINRVYGHWVLHGIEATEEAFPEPLNAPETVNEQKVSEPKFGTINHKESNFFKRNGDFWTIQFEGKESRPIKHVDGLLYMAYLLERPDTPIPCEDLYQSVSGGTPDETISEGAAIEQGLSIGNSKQEINDNDAKKIYCKKYNELQGDLQNVESDLERQEIEKEMNAILQCLKKQNFVDPKAKKTQANITKRLNVAYDSIHNSGMKELAKHLRDNIKTDGAYGRIYSGSINWEIIIG